MSRLAAIARALYYPTPLRVVAGIAAHLDLAPVERPGPLPALHILDPCAGTGEAVSFLAHLLAAPSRPEAGPRPAVQVHGIELDRERAAAARPRLSSLLLADALTARVGPSRVSLLFHNPPYDDVADEDGRLEHTFLKRFTPTLQPGGVLVHIVGQRQLAHSAAFLARAYRQLTVYRFPDPEFGLFRQVVLFGIRREQPIADSRAVLQLTAWATGQQPLAPLPCPDLPALEQLVAAWGQAGPAWAEEQERLRRERPERITVAAPSAPPLVVPPDTTAAPFRCQSGAFNPDQALYEASQGGVWSNRALRERLGDGGAVSTGALRPLLPLREGQAALLIAVGLLNNMVLADEDGSSIVLVKGALRKQYILLEETTNERGKLTKRVEREVIEASLTCLDLGTGTVTRIEPTELADFIARYRTSITARLRDLYPPWYTPTPGQPAADPLLRHLEEGLRYLGRWPKGAQGRASVALALSLLRQRGTFCSAEQGSGKTYMSLAAVALAGYQRVVVSCPPHLVGKWAREVGLTLPGAQTRIVRTITELDAACTCANRMRLGQPFVIIISRERLKLGHYWRPAAVWRAPRPYPTDEVTGRPQRTENGAFLRLPHCPRCGELLKDREGAALTETALAKRKHRCPECREPLWTATATLLGSPPFGHLGGPRGSGPRRVPLADYIKQKWSGFFDVAILDEVHELKGADSAQGLASATLSAACRRTLALTGTLSGGYSTNLFPLLWRFSDAIRAYYSLHDTQRWAEHYGILERITHFDEDDDRETVADGAFSARRETKGVKLIERPGLNPAVLLHLLGNTVFLRLRDVEARLPPYEEHIVQVGLRTAPDPDAGADPHAPSQASAYERLANALYAAVRQELRRNSTRLLGALLQSLLGWPDNPTLAETVRDPRNGEVIASAPALSADVLYPKEEALVQLARREQRAGRRLIVFITNTATRDLSPRLTGILSREGLRVAVLKSDTVEPARREAWVAGQVKAGCDVLLVHPRLVQTGLDLIDFPTLVFYQIEYSTYVMRQASRRSWRIGQHAPIHVYHFAYTGTLQQQALYHIARKVQASNLLEGELGAEGLLALAEEDAADQSLMLNLARSIVAARADARGAAAEESPADLPWDTVSLATPVPSPVASVPANPPLPSGKPGIAPPPTSYRAPQQPSVGKAVQLSLF